ncbi:cytochrome P450 [Catenulispora acidiphila DSM 44928]|uniref:Cytochrome P450 n=1 Tax=Catenulispora acidiphila (strain DSM 44928 / JCM 14897 / NBRC 102108 / NRRL B-24433 / ID139908) TaxID=479433 RepID=C7Q895_CATAD|nr:cytochrome P450 [Catenulispora acidiphila]ACU76083.1 cytochrome P450 [Catenulispora acidiphila DSM 44928]
MTVEIFHPETYAHAVPYERFAELRRATPVCWVEEPAVGAWPAGSGYWGVFAHADVKRVLRDPQTFSSHLGGTQIRDPETADDLGFVRAMMLNQDPPAQSRLRRIVAAAFTPRAIRRLEETIAERARMLVDAVLPAGRADFVEVAADLPVWTLARIMGVPDEDRRLLYDWANRVIGYQDTDYAGLGTADAAALSPLGRAALAERPATMTRPDGRPLNPRSRAGLADMYAYAHGLAAEPPAATPDTPGIVGRLLAEGLTDAEFENMFFLFAVAGNETLRNGIPGALLTLLQHPDQLDHLRRDPEARLDTAVDELLRHWPPVIQFRRTATCDVTLGGREIRAGDKVVVYHASANRDETVFPDPDRLDLTRTPNDHVTFGFGPHYCLGAHLAKTQMRAMLGQVLTRMPHIRPDGDPVRLTSNFQNGLKHLPVRWD